MTSEDHGGRIEGIGGIFFRSRDPAALRAWYVEHLDLPSEMGTTLFPWRHDEDPERRGHTVWAPFDADSSYFGDGAELSERPADWMINYRVDDLDAVLARLRSEGVEVVDRIEDSEFGRFGWAIDLEGHRFELWEPPPGQ